MKRKIISLSLVLMFLLNVAFPNVGVLADTGVAGEQTEGVPAAGEAMRSASDAGIQPAGSKDITHLVNKKNNGIPDVYAFWSDSTKSYLVKDGKTVLYNDKMQEDPNGKPQRIRKDRMVEFYYQWDIPQQNMTDVHAGDFFVLRLPEFLKLENFGFDPGKPIAIGSSENPGETLGSFVIDTAQCSRSGKKSRNYRRIF